MQYLAVWNPPPQVKKYFRKYFKCIKNTFFTSVAATEDVHGRRDAATNAETGEMAAASSGQYDSTAVLTDHDWTLVNGGGSVADVEGATSGVEQLHVHMTTAPADVPTAPVVPGT